MSHNNICYFNGSLLPYSKVRIHVSDLLLQRGYGIFDFFRTRGGTHFWLNDYTDRIFRSLELAELDAPLERDSFISLVHRIHELNQLDNGAFKIIITGGYSDTLDAVTGDPNMLILNIPWKAPSKESFSEGVRLLDLEYTRPDPEIKTLNYFNTLRLRKKMKETNAIDLLFHGDFISEASRANLFFVKGRDILTPSENILHGITRKQLLKKTPGIKVTNIPWQEIYGFDEVFMSSTSRDITPVVSVSGKKIGGGKPGPVTREIMEIMKDPSD